MNAPDRLFPDDPAPVASSVPLTGYETTLPLDVAPAEDPAHEH